MKLGQLIKELEKKRKRYGDDIRVIQLAPHDKWLLSQYPNDKNEHWYFCKYPKMKSTYKWNGKPMGKVIVL